MRRKVRLIFEDCRDLKRRWSAEVKMEDGPLSGGDAETPEKALQELAQLLRDLYD